MPNLPELLLTYLDALEDLIQKDLSDPRTARGAPIPWIGGANLRQLDLMDALEAIRAAREELAQCPQGARLAFHVLGAHLHRLRQPVESARLRELGGLKGAHAPKRKTQRSAVQRHAAIRRQAATLNPKLTVAAKAKKLAGKYPNSARIVSVASSAVNSWLST